jgi:hypothetical protein
VARSAHPLGLRCLFVCLQVMCFFLLWLSFTANVEENAYEFGVLRAIGLNVRYRHSRDALTAALSHGGRIRNSLDPCSIELFSVRVFALSYSPSKW